MRVSVRLVLDVDPAAWRELYGDMTTDELRADVRAYAAAQLQDSAAADELALRGVELVLRLT